MIVNGAELMPAKVQREMMCKNDNYVNYLSHRAKRRHIIRATIRLLRETIIAAE